LSSANVYKLYHVSLLLLLLLLVVVVVVVVAVVVVVVVVVVVAVVLLLLLTLKAIRLKYHTLLMDDMYLVMVN